MPPSAHSVSFPYTAVAESDHVRFSDPVKIAVYLMRYGFVIDQDRCIGCHACTVACKEEHQVPIGVFRTWVKYVEKGEFPHTSRHFGVMRCNHCDSAPCIEICPTHALYRRSDGIVDFDNQRCIGCKSCMQACPYDALYIDPNTNTAAKCNFCAHRVENNLEPACVIVCPTQAIIAGDLDNPVSNASRIVATEKVSVRKPEKGTEPKLFYKGIEGDLLQPTRLSRQNTFVFAEQRDERPVQPFDPAVTREVYDVAHPAPWGWKIAAYLWTKSIAAGVLMVPALHSLIDRHSLQQVVFTIVSPWIALVALAVTMALLVFDLKRPDRFHYLLLKPNFRSWLVLGAYILMGYGICALAWLWMGFSSGAVPAPLAIVTTIFAIGTACYSTFLFAQAKGRELWRGKAFFCWHLFIQALLAGGAVIIILQQMIPSGVMTDTLWFRGGLIDSVSVFGQILLLNLITLLIEILIPRKNQEKQLAIRSLTYGKFAGRFWISVVFLGVLCPLFLPRSLLSRFAEIVIALLALYGLWWFELLWVKAGQVVPLS